MNPEELLQLQHIVDDWRSKAVMLREKGLDSGDEETTMKNMMVISMWESCANVLEAKVDGLPLTYYKQDPDNFVEFELCSHCNRPSKVPDRKNFTNTRRAQCLSCGRLDR